MTTVDPHLHFRENLTPVRYAANEALDLIDELERGQIGFGSGIMALDEMITFAPGELVAIGARSGTGKTALGLQITYNILRELEDSGKAGQVCVFSAEMTGSRLIMREACAREKVPLWKMYKRKTTADESNRVRARVREIGEYKRLFIDETGAPTLEHMIDQLEIMKEEYGRIAFVLFDYTELSGEFDRVESQRIAKISRGLKNIAKKYKCPVLTLSQLNRDIESRTDRTPTMRDMMYGGEREPDCIVILVQPYLYDETEPDGLTYATVVKNRNGPRGKATLFFEGETMRFKSAEIVRSNLDKYDDE